MGLSKASLIGLKIFEPNSIQSNDLDFLETLKFETKEFRNQDYLEKGELLHLTLKRIKSVKPKLPMPTKKSQQQKLLEDFCKKLDKTLMIKNDDSTINEVKWEKLDDFCSTLRRIERSDERKVRWTLYFLWRMGKSKITISEISEKLKDFFDDKILKINHEIDDKLVWHYLGDEIQEESRRSPGDVEKEILQLIDEGSYSATEISDILKIDEATISRAFTKLRKNEKIILSSFGDRGSRFYTTNCENCPFGTTKAACRKDALAYIIDYFQNYFGVELSSHDFEEIEENQALLKIKRIVSFAKKEKNTKLERSITLGLADLFGTAVDKSLEISSKSDSPEDVNLITNDRLAKLPVLFHLGLFKGAQTSNDMMNEIMKVTKSISRSDRVKIKNIVESHPKKFLGYAGLKK
jgi:DNA-binding transcriptional ArsR family regulator